MDKTPVTYGGSRLCESNVFIRNDEGDRLVMEDAVLVKAEGDHVKLTDILGDERDVEGRIEEITFLDHKIIIR